MAVLPVKTPMKMPPPWPAPAPAVAVLPDMVEFVIVRLPALVPLSKMTPPPTPCVAVLLEITEPL